MNKLFSKLGTLLLGASLVVAGGVAVSSKKASEAGASEAVAYTLSGTTTSTGNSYSAETAVTQGSVSWNVNANVSTNPWRFGGHKNNGLSEAGTIRHVQSQVAVSSYDITKVIVTSAKPSKNAITPTDVSLKVGTAIGGSTISSLSNGSWTSSVTFEKPSSADWSSKFFEIDFTMPANTTTTNKYIELGSIVFYYESTTPRGEVEINDIGSRVIELSSAKTLSYTWTPASGSSATVSSASWESSNTDVLQVSGNQITGVGAGFATVTLNVTDSLNEEYSVTTESFFVTNPYGFDVGDNVALYSATGGVELSGISDTSTKYGTVVEYSGEPSGTYSLAVEEGVEAGSFAFVHETSYLSWTSGNSLNVASTKTVNESWFLINRGEYYDVYNAETNARQIYHNPGNTTTLPRFAAYTSKSSSYNDMNFKVLDEVPVRGTLEITSPTEKTMRQGLNGELTYSWTPNGEASEATITSYSWSSNNPEVISVDGDLYTAEAAGKAKLTLNATDSTGEEYTVVGSEIEVIAVVSGSYEKKTSVAVGDTITFVCEEDGTQISGVASNIGQYVFYETAPADVYTFVVEAGSESDSYALRHDDKYLAWTGNGSSKSANIGLVDSIATNSSWTVSFDEGNVTVSNCDLDGEGHRYIAWNHGSPRFAAYKTGQTAIQLYGPDTPEVYGATEFANELISMTDEYCAAYEGETKTYAELKDLYATVWSTLSGADHYGKLSDTDIGLLVNADAKESSEDPIEVAMYRYDLITAKYALDGFITDRPAAAFSIYSPSYQSNIDSSSSITIIVIVAVASMTLLGVTLVLRKRKHQ